MTRKTRSHGVSTVAVHGGSERADADAPVVTPLYQSVNFVQEIGTGEGLRYPRYGNTPNAEIVQRRLALLRGPKRRSCWRAVWERRPAHSSPCSVLAIISSRVRGCTAGRTDSSLRNSR
jgi:hypothetical protein